MATPKLDEIRSNLRQLTKFAESVTALNELMAAATDLETDTAQYRQAQDAIAIQKATLDQEHAEYRNNLAKEKEALSADIEKTRVAANQVKSAITADLEEHRARHVATLSSYSAQRKAESDATARHAAEMLKARKDAMALHQAELTAMQAEHEKLAADIEALKEERNKVLSRFHA